MSLDPPPRPPVIGLEVHVQLETERKLFSPALRRHAPETPNVYIDPFSIGLPGALPVLNPAAVELAVRVALALDCTVHPISAWDRKHYFYPDLPKGFQITQHRRPLATGGVLEILGEDDLPKAIRIQRVHIEEDAGKSTHGTDGKTRVDFNRAGAPLVEVVSAPDLVSPVEARRFLKRLRSLVRAIGASTARMQEGELRCDANISLGGPTPGCRVELKNLNSFRHVEQALAYEIQRQQAAPDRVAAETRQWDAATRTTRALRAKQTTADYRYLPEPDLPPLVLTPAAVAEARARLPERPAQRAARYRAAGLAPANADPLSDDPPLADAFDAAIRQRPNRAVEIASVLLGEVSRLRNADARNDDIRIAAAVVAELADLKARGRISSTQQKALVTRAWTDSLTLAELESASLLNDATALRPLVEEVLDRHPNVVAKYRGGKRRVIGFLVGQVMAASEGQADPPTVHRLLEEGLENHE